MIDSRKIEDLHPLVQLKAKAFKEEAQKQGLDFIITSTLRDIECQNELYKIGRTVKGQNASPKRPMGSVVTNAVGGRSFHNYGVAFDICPRRFGKLLVWNTSGDGLDTNPADDDTDDLELWLRLANIGKSLGLEWAGDWKTFKEFPHFQFTQGLTLNDFAAGKKLK